MNSERAQHRPGQGGTTQIACSDTDRAQRWLQPPKDLAQVGVVNCGFVEAIGSSTVRAGVPLLPLDHEATVEFSFHKKRLFRIDTYMDSEVSGAIAEALEAKFGKPTSTAKGHFQTESGALFPQTIALWRRGGQSVTMTTPDLSTQRMSVIYLLEDMAAEVSRLARTARNPAVIM